MRAIDFGTAFKALNAYVDDYNYRTEKLADKLRQTTISTAQDIIKIYAMAFRRYEQLRKQTGLEDLSLPSVFLNNVQLSFRLKINKRTVQRHIAKLQEAGIITQKLWHGTNSGYEVWLNEKILGLGEQAEYVKANFQKALKTELLNEESTTCRHTVSCTQDTNIITNSSVEKCTTEQNQADSGYTTGDTKRKLVRSCTELDSNGSKWNQNESKEGGGGFSTNQNFYVDSLWSEARKKLYPDKQFSEGEIIKIKNLLLPYYQLPPEHLQSVHLIYLKRIQLVQKYLKRDINRFVPPPLTYFTIGNKTGFTATKQWYENYRSRLIEQREQSEVKRIINQYLKALTETRLAEPLYQLFRQCEERLTEFKNKTLLEHFYKSVRDKTPVLFLTSKANGLLRQ